MKIGYYQVVEILAKTGRSLVLKGYDFKHAREVAFKQVEDPELAHLEARRINRFTHPNVIKLYDTFQSGDGKFVLVLELVQGCPLIEAIPTLSRGRVLTALIQLAGAIENIHNKNEVYGDLKHSNVLYDHVSHQVKLVDFGTRSGDCTRGYLAPEHEAGHPQPVGPHTDIYLFGILLRDYLPDARDLIDLCMNRNTNERPKMLAILHKLEQLKRTQLAMGGSELALHHGTQPIFGEDGARDENHMLRMFSNGENLESELSLMRKYHDDPRMANLVPVKSDSTASINGTGAVTLERIEGVPFFDWLREPLEDSKKLSALLELARLLAHMHEQGDRHGNLLPESIIYDEANELPVVVGPTWTEGTTKDDLVLQSPEHFRGGPINPASDVYVFAKHYLSVLTHRPSVSKIIAACTADDPEKRPSMAQVVKSLTHQASGVVRRPGWYISAAAALIVAAFILLPGKNIISETSNTTLHSVGHFTTHRLAAMEPLDFQRPLAVLNYADETYLLGRHDYARVGDTVNFPDGTSGTMVALKPLYAVVAFQGQRGPAKTFSFETPSFQVEPESKGIIVWYNGSNLTDLLHGMARLQGLRFVDDHTIEGRAFGLFEFDDTAQFLKWAESKVGLSQDGGQLRFYDDGRLPLLIRWPFYYGRSFMSAAALQTHLETWTGFPVVFQEEIQFHNEEIVIVNSGWQELFDAYNLDWYVDQTGPTPTIRVVGTKQ